MVMHHHTVPHILFLLVTIHGFTLCPEMEGKDSGVTQGARGDARLFPRSYARNPYGDKFRVRPSSSVSP